MSFFPFWLKKLKKKNRSRSARQQRACLLHDYDNATICVIVPLCVCSYYCMCVIRLPICRTTICVIRLAICRTTICVSSDSLYVVLLYVSSYYYVCARTTICVSSDYLSYYYMCVIRLAICVVTTQERTTAASHVCVDTLRFTTQFTCFTSRHRRRRSARHANAAAAC
jgi:hypothetical protein